MDDGSTKKGREKPRLNWRARVGGGGGGVIDALASDVPRDALFMSREPGDVVAQRDATDSAATGPTDLNQPT